jgi:hypothetical protein
MLDRTTGSERMLDRTTGSSGALCTSAMLDRTTGSERMLDRTSGSSGALCTSAMLDRITGSRGGLRPHRAITFRGGLRPHRAITFRGGLRPHRAITFRGGLRPHRVVLLGRTTGSRGRCAARAISSLQQLSYETQDFKLVIPAGLPALGIGAPALAILALLHLLVEVLVRRGHCLVHLLLLVRRSRLIVGRITGSRGACTSAMLDRTTGSGRCAARTAGGALLNRINGSIGRLDRGESRGRVGLPGPGIGLGVPLVQRGIDLGGGLLALQREAIVEKTGL